MIDLRSSDLPWAATRIGGANVDVDLARLHVDPASRATVSVVRFPPTWQRPGTGHYPCAEELLVIDGSITVSGVEYAAGDYGYLPPYATRTASTTPAGCLALAWFSGVPAWIEGTAEDRVTHEAVHGSPLGVSRPARPDVLGSSEVLGQPPQRVDVPTEVVYLPDWRWLLLPAGSPVPDRPGPVLLRRWRSA